MSATFLTPSVERLLEQVAAGPAPDPSAEGQRRALDSAMAALGYPAPAHRAASSPLQSGGKVVTFAPEGDTVADVGIVYFHGGSFIAGGAVSHAGIAQALSDTTGAQVMLVDYRLAPEHPLPQGRDDCVEAALALALKGPLVLLGDSAGGWLAIETALALARAAPGAVQRLVLVNPMIGPSTDTTGSLKDYAARFFAGTDDFADAWRLAGPWAVDRAQPGGDDADLSALPTTVVITNEADPVRDEGEAFAERLSRAGVVTLSLRARGLVHAAWLFPQVLPEANALLDVIAGATGMMRRSSFTAAHPHRGGP